jgi:AcrR family transcriptional regulator
VEEATTAESKKASASETPAVRQSSPRVARKRVRRMQEILDATSAVLGERGYDGTSLDEVAERLDLTKASIYHYFESSGELLTACLEYIADSVDERLRQQTERDAALPAPERLRRLIETQALILLNDYPHLTELFTRRIEWPEPYRKRIKAMRDRHDQYFRDVIDAGVASGEFQCADPTLARHCVHGALNYLPVWYRRGRQQRPVDIAADLSDMLLLMLVPSTPPPS